MYASCIDNPDATVLVSCETALHVGLTNGEMADGMQRRFSSRAHYARKQQRRRVTSAGHITNVNFHTLELTVTN